MSQNRSLAAASRGLSHPRWSDGCKQHRPTGIAGTPPLSTPWTDDVSPANALPEYPRPQLTRPEWRNLNGLWEFARPRAGRGSPRSAARSARRSSCPYPIESALSGLQRHEDRMWYRRTFTVPDSWKGQRLVLHFGAVDYDAKVWVNGRQVATHRGGYDGFDVDVTNALHRQRPAGADRLGRGPHRRDLPADRQAARGRRPRHLLPRQLRHLADRLDGAGRTPPPSTASSSRRICRARPSRSPPTPSGPAGLDVEVTAYDGTPAGRPGHAARRTPSSRLPDPEPEDLVAGQSVPVRPQGPAHRRAARPSTRSVRTPGCARSAW